MKANIQVGLVPEISNHSPINRNFTKKNKNSIRRRFANYFPFQNLCDFAPLSASSLLGVCLFALLLPITALAQGTLQDYQRAEQFLPQNVEKLVSGDQFRPSWIDSTSRFWYTKDLAEGKEFMLVDAGKNSLSPAFDHAKLAAALSTALGKEHAATKLPFNAFEFIDNGKALRFDIDTTRWVCNLQSYRLTKSEQIDETPNGQSPDGKWLAFLKDHNLYIRANESGEEIQLTDDGQDKYGYAFRPRWGTLINESTPEPVDESRVNVRWSPDSQKLVTFRLDRRNAQSLYLYQSMPEKGMRAQVFSYERALPGDTLLSMIEFYIFDIASRKKIAVDLPSHPAFLSGTPDWFADGKRLHSLKWQRGYNTVALLEIDAATGKTRTLFTERSDTNVDVDYLTMRVVNPVGYASNGVNNDREIFWTSERDGWNHVYLYDANSGALKNQITKGAFVVREIVHIDEAARVLYFTAGGREKGRDPYFRHLYKVRFDGSGLTLLTPEDADHDISFSLTGDYFVDNFSRVDLAPKTVLRRSTDGKIIRTLQEADIAKLLATGWKYPERFQVKARDGETDIYGVIFRPSNFDPAKSYPVIDATYSGPQAVRTPKTFRRGYRNSDQPIAELGFIVVTIDGMGTAQRSKAFHNVSHANLGDIGAPDHIAGLRQLAERYPYMDLTRVGIYGHSAGGYDAAHAVLKHPDFYKVAVASAGNHDHRMAKVWWPEFWMGKLGPHYEAQSNLTIAGNLQGKLLLVHGDLDNNVNPASTLRLAGELIKANKDFDLLIIPNRRHGLGDHRYFIRKRWDYFVQHLLGVEPPKEYRIKPFDGEDET